MPALLPTSVIIFLHQPCLALAWLAFVVTESAELLSVCVMQTLTEPGCDARSPETLAVRGISPLSPKCQKFKCLRVTSCCIGSIEES